MGISFNQVNDLLEIRNCRFENNASGLEGGGIGYKYSAGELNIINCDLSANGAADRGGGLYASGGTLTIVNTIFTGNTTNSNQGGGAYINQVADALFINCLFASNTAGTDGGAVRVGHESTTAVFNNCTFSKNHAGYRGGGIMAMTLSTITVTNCILWANTDTDGGTDTEEAQLLLLSGMATVTYTCIEGCVVFCDDPNDNNIPDDPLFVDPPNNYRLAADSPCMEVADNDAVVCDEFDVDENMEGCPPAEPQDTPDLDFGVRIVDGDEDMTAVVDMGAYESVPCPWDLDGNCDVGIGDLLILLPDWGNPYGIGDLLALLAAWGPCQCAPDAEPLTLEEELADACLTMDHWNAFVAVMSNPNASQEDKDRYNCWMTHYLDHCNKCTCEHLPECPSPDPFSST